MFKKNLRPEIALDAHKYSRGIVAVVAGSDKYPGAALLTVAGARHGGAGYVKFLPPNKSVEELVIARFPDVVPISTLTRQRCDAIVLGPGGATLRKIPDLIPLVLDSAALPIARRKRDGITVVTPHEGELALLGYERSDRQKIALKIARDLGVIVVLKGPKTLVASAGNEIHIDLIGGRELATAGSGDILAGLIGSMLSSWKPKDSKSAHQVVCQAVELHSRAGRFAAKKFRSVTALEIAESLPFV